MLLFAELKIMMEDGQNHQAYYEAAYERLIEKYKKIIRKNNSVNRIFKGEILNVKSKKK